MINKIEIVDKIEIFTIFSVFIMHLVIIGSFYW